MFEKLWLESGWFAAAARRQYVLPLHAVTDRLVNNSFRDHS
jgi:hypothetical protein